MRPHEDGVGGPGTRHGYVGHQGLCQFDGRGQHSALFVPKSAVLGGMWIECRDGDSRVVQLQTLFCSLVRNLNGLHELRGAEPIDGLAKRQVNGIKHDRELRVDQHHAHRRWFEWVDQVCQEFGVTWPQVAC